MKKFIQFICVLIIYFGFIAPPVCAVPDNGIQREYYPNGRIRLENRWKNERVVRKRTWYRNGRLMTDFRFKNGQLILKRTYHENGRLKSQWLAKTNITLFYDDKGRLRDEFNAEANILNPGLKSSYIFSTP